MSTLIKLTHDYGFFSNCTVRLRTIINHYNTNNKELCEVDSSAQWSLYKDDGEWDVTDRFFKFNDVKIESNPAPIVFADSEDQFSDYKLLNYEFVSPFIDRYFYPSNEVLQIKDFIKEKYNISSSNTISICYRGNDKHTETHIPSYDEMLIKTYDVYTKNPEKKILIQSDEIEFCKFMKNHFPKCIIIEETKKMNKTPFSYIPHTIEPGHRVINAQIFLASLLLISDSSELLMNSSNVFMWLCFFRKSSNNIHQYLNPLNSNQTDNKWI